MINNGNLQFISTVSPQVIYLDFDGADAVYCNRDLDLDFNVTVRDSGMTEAEKRYILSALTEKYRFDDLYFTIEPPTEIEEFSTVYIGETEDFDSFSIFAGLAETIDPDNRIRNDNAFVLTNHVKGAAAIVSVIEHEICLGGSFLKKTNRAGEEASGQATIRKGGSGISGRWIY